MLNNVSVEPSREAPFPGPLRILFVDDDADTRTAMVRLLRSEGYLAYAAGTCEAARRTAEEIQPDLLITDYLLPDGDGLSVLHHVKMIGLVRAILITGVAGSIPAVDGSADHFAERLVKPVEFSSILAAIRSILGDSGVSEPRKLPSRATRMDA